MQNHEPRKIRQITGKTYTSQIVLVKDTQADNAKGDPYHFAGRTVYQSGKVIYSVEWGVQPMKGFKADGAPMLYRVHSTVSMKQAVHFKHEIMRILNSHPALIIVKKQTDTGAVVTRLIDTDAMMAAGMPDAPFYDDNERLMYGYGMPQPREV